MALRDSPKGTAKPGCGKLRQMLDEEFADRVLPFDEDAVHYAALVSQRERAGRPISMADAQIAAICRHHTARPGHAQRQGLRRGRHWVGESLARLM